MQHRGAADGLRNDGTHVGRCRLTHSEEDAQRAWQAVEVFAQTCDMTLYLDKCGAVYIGNGPRILDDFGTFRFLITELVPLQRIDQKYGQGADTEGNAVRACALAAASAIQ